MGNNNKFDEKIAFYINTQENTDIEYSMDIILGQQLYLTILFSYIFLNITQDYKKYRQLLQIPREELLYEYIRILGINTLWESDSYGISSKIQKSFAILSLQYHIIGYDSVYSSFKQAADKYFENFLNTPIIDYTKFLESYLWKRYKEKIVIKSKINKQFSPTDIVWESSTVFLGKLYRSIGYNRKNSAESLCREIVLKEIPYSVIAKESLLHNIRPIQKNRLQLGSFEYAEKDETIVAFINKYGLDEFLVRLSLLTRSDNGEMYLSNIGITNVISKNDVPIIRKGIIELGREFALIITLDYILKNNLIDFNELIPLNETISILGHNEIHEQLIKILHLEEFLTSLFETDKLSRKAISDKEKSNIESGIIGAFFLSSFTPEKIIFQNYENTFRSVYSEGNSEVIDHRFSVLAFLAEFDIEPQTNHHEVGNGFFHAEVNINSPDGIFQFVCENESMRFAKKEVWRIAYEQLITKVKVFFETSANSKSMKPVQFFVHNICKQKLASPLLLSRYGILCADNFKKIDPNICSAVIRNIRASVDSRTLSEFFNLVCKSNGGKYLCVDDNVYSYTDWIHYSFDTSKAKNFVQNQQLISIYSDIANPSIGLQKKLIDEDYRNIKQINPLSDEIALYALDKSLDTYNYLPYTSATITAYYEKLKSKEIDFSNIGMLSVNLDMGVSVSIMDSQKPFHQQLLQILSLIKINSITIACGYCFDSGLTLLKDVILDNLKYGIPFELYIGSLQNYGDSDKENLITGINKTTIQTINSYLSFRNFELFTCPDRFYHGKLYIFEGKDVTVVVVGSSNVSRSAFISNYEMNLVFQIPTNSKLAKNFIIWKNQLKYYSKKLDKLDESLFTNNEIRLDGSSLIKRVSQSAMLNRIRNLTNAEVQYRLNLWMTYNPDVIAEDLGILALPNYFVFEYRKYGLIVLESFEAGNAYFCIKTVDSFDNVINSISTFTKSEIFELSGMPRRGYHVQNKFTLENNIRKFFQE